MDRTFIEEAYVSGAGEALLLSFFADPVLVDEIIAMLLALVDCGSSNFSTSPCTSFNPAELVGGEGFCARDDYLEYLDTSVHPLFRDEYHQAMSIYEADLALYKSWTSARLFFLWSLYLYPLALIFWHLAEDSSAFSKWFKKEKRKIQPFYSSPMDALGPRFVVLCLWQCFLSWVPVAAASGYDNKEDIGAAFLLYLGSFVSLFYASRIVLCDKNFEVPIFSELDKKAHSGCCKLCNQLYDSIVYRFSSISFVRNQMETLEYAVEVTDETYEITIQFLYFLSMCTFYDQAGVIAYAVVLALNLFTIPIFLASNNLNFRTRFSLMIDSTFDLTFMTLNFFFSQGQPLNFIRVISLLAPVVSVSYRLQHLLGLSMTDQYFERQAAKYLQDFSGHGGGHVKQSSVDLLSVSNAWKKADEKSSSNSLLQCCNCFAVSDQSAVRLQEIQKQQRKMRLSISHRNSVSRKSSSRVAPRNSDSKNPGLAARSSASNSSELVRQVSVSRSHIEGSDLPSPLSRMGSRAIEDVELEPLPQPTNLRIGSTPKLLRAQSDLCMGNGHTFPDGSDTEACTVCGAPRVTLLTLSEARTLSDPSFTEMTLPSDQEVENAYRADDLGGDDGSFENFAVELEFRCFEAAVAERLKSFDNHFIFSLKTQVCLYVICFTLALLLLFATLMRIQMQQVLCVDKASTLLWTSAYPKIYFANGFFEPPICAYDFVTDLTLTLKIAGDEFSVLPEQVCLFKSLQTLTAVAVGLESLPGCIFTDLTALRVLDVQENNLAALPRDIEFTNVTELRLNGNPLLQHLDMSGCDPPLTVVPAVLWPISNLFEEWDFSRNALSSFPDLKFSKLTFLNASFNQLESVSLRSENSPALQVLDLSNNRLSLFGTQFCALNTWSNLQLLDLRSNFISDSIPDNLIRFEMDRPLGYLDLSNNPLHELWFVALQDIPEFPSFLSRLASLKELHLVYSNMAIRTDLGGMSQLEILDISTYQPSVPLNISYLYSCPKLVYLRMDEAELVNPELLCEMTNLTFLEISNQLHSVKNVLCVSQLIRLEVFQFDCSIAHGCTFEYLDAVVSLITQHNLRRVVLGPDIDLGYNADYDTGPAIEYLRNRTGLSCRGPEEYLQPSCCGLTCPVENTDQMFVDWSNFTTPQMLSIGHSWDSENFPRLSYCVYDFVGAINASMQVDMQVNLDVSSQCSSSIYSTRSGLMFQEVWWNETSQTERVVDVEFVCQRTLTYTLLSRSNHIRVVFLTDINKSVRFTDTSFFLNITMTPSF